MVYGGGGVYGIAFNAGVAEGLADAGIPVATAPALGTSAGSWAASGIALGMTYADVSEFDAPKVPTRERGILAGIAREIFGEARHPLVSASAFRITAPLRGRHILSGANHALADLCAASSAAPGFLPPHVIDGHTYLDGGVRSAVSVAHAAPADHVIVVAPLATGVLGPMGAGADFQLSRELGAWMRRNHTGTLTVVRPTREIARMAGRRNVDLFDADRARDVYPLAVAEGRRVGALLRHPVGSDAPDEGIEGVERVAPVADLATG
jgi:NTE family protein